jgi:hypothetical protein
MVPASRGVVMKRDLLTRQDGGGPNRRPWFGVDKPARRTDSPDQRKPGPDISVRADVDTFEEPTWEVRPAGRSDRRLDRRTRSILAAAAAAALVVNAGAAWAYWKVTASKTGAVQAGSAVALNLRGRSDLNKPLTRGGVGNMTVTLTNDHDFPIRITSVSPGPGNVIADDEHRDAGCIATGVTMTQRSFPVSWEVPRNTIGAFTLPDALRMAADANPNCVGAMFTVPVHTNGVSGR